MVVVVVVVVDVVVEPVAKQLSATLQDVAQVHNTAAQKRHIVLITKKPLGLLPPTKEEVNAIAVVCLSVCMYVCMSVSKITQKRVDGFG